MTPPKKAGGADGAASTTLSLHRAFVHVLDADGVTPVPVRAISTRRLARMEAAASGAATGGSGGSSEAAASVAADADADGIPDVYEDGPPR